jgi:hypothetical protein
MTNRPTAKDNAKRYASVIQALHACETACAYCVAECSKNGHAEAMSRLMSLCTDCAEYCALTQAFLARNSEFAELLLEDCAELCHQCAEECDHHGLGHCSTCATACRACMDACLKTAGVDDMAGEPTVF